MSQLTLNGNHTPIDHGFQTWQQLLADLESNRLTDNEVIASVHFDGDEIMNFRQDEALKLPLDSIQEVRVEAIGRNEMLSDAVQEAEAYLASLNASMLEVAEKFRNGKPDQANPRLQQVFEGIKMFVALLRGVELSLDGPASAQGSTVEKTLEQMGKTLHDEIKAQTQQDWTLVADILEYELASDLHAFEEVLAGFKSRIGSN
jgi:hypothetical protein